MTLSVQMIVCVMKTIVSVLASLIIPVLYKQSAMSLITKLFASVALAMKVTLTSSVKLPAVLQMITVHPTTCA